MKNEKPTIIILTPGFAADEMDSTCLPVQQTFVKALKENFSKLNIIILSFQYPFFRDEYKWHGVDVICLNGRNRKKLYRLLLWRRAIKQLNNIYTENSVIGLLSFWCGECAWIGKKFGQKHDLKHYCWLWGQDAKKGNKFVKWMRPSENELIALSDFLQSEFERNYSVRPAHVIPPGIDTRQFNSRNNIRDIDILGAGSLIPLKQFNIFISIISDLTKYFPKIRAVICGNGPEETNLQKQIEDLRLQNNLVLTGEMQHHEMLQLMQRCKVFLHPSSYEGFSGVCQEALYAGSHVISFCRAMNHEIKHWHVVKSMEEIIEKAKEILQSSSTNFEPVQTYNARDVAKSMMALFGYKEEIT